MKELDLMRAINDLDDDILTEADRPAPRRRTRLLPRIAAAAAVALLCGAVYAFNSETRVTFPNEENSIIFQDFEHEGITYSHVEVEYDLQPVTIRPEAMDFLNEMAELVSSGSGSWYGEDGRYTGIYYSNDDGPIEYGITYPEQPKFDSIAEAEEFFGLTFALPQIVRSAALSTYEHQDRITLWVNAIGEVGEDGFLRPDVGGARMNFWAVDPAEDLDAVYVNIYLGLTEEYTAVPATGGSFMALEELGEPEIQELRIGDEEFTILTFAQDPNNDATVYYVRDGIGYSLDFQTAEDCTGDPVKLILPWLERLG